MRMAGICRLQLVWASAAVVAGLASAAACAHAQGQPWRHGVIEPKSDAGFQVMAVRGGFAAKQGLKLELPSFQKDVVALGGPLAGELQEEEGRAANALLPAAPSPRRTITGT